MCQSKANGGQRCDYSDQITNVRKKAKYKYRNIPLSQQEKLVKEAVTKWKKANKQIVLEHLPETCSFQIAPGRKPLPDSIKTMLTVKSTTPVTAGSQEEQETVTERMYHEHEKWVEVLKEEEEWSVSNYAMNGYIQINALLRRKGINEMIRENPDLKDGGWKDKTRTRISEIDSALKKASELNKHREPHRLYRFYKVPDGVTPTQFIEKYFQEGEGYTDRGYMSTSADPEFIMSSLHKKNKGKRNINYVVMEIVTKQGASLQASIQGQSGNIQSLEKEYLLPRNMKFRIAGVRKQQVFEFGSARSDLYSHHATNWHTGSIPDYETIFQPGDTRRFPMIQLVDEKLIRET